MTWQILSETIVSGVVGGLIDHQLGPLEYDEMLYMIWQSHFPSENRGGGPVIQ